MEKKAEKKTEKKELKIMLGILLTVVVLAIITAVVIVAIRAGASTSILFRGKYDYVDSVMVDGAVVTARDGEYKLVKEDREISRRYTSLEFHFDERTYSFTTADGYKGELSADGKELFRRKITGNELSEKNRTAEIFYYTETAGVQTVHYGSQSLTLQGTERVYSYEEKSLPDLPLGVVLFQSGSDDFISNIAGSLKFKLSNVRFHASNKIITVFDGGSYKSYRLPKLEHIPFLDGAESEGILTDTSGNVARYEYQSAQNSHIVSFQNGSATVSYQLPEAPAKVLAIKNNTILICFTARSSGDPEQVGLYMQDAALKGLYTRLTDELFTINNNIYRFDTLEKLSVTITTPAETRALVADGKQYIYLNRALYNYANGTLTQVLGSAGEVTYHLYKGKLYFVSGGTLYNNKLGTITTGVTMFVGDNLILKSGSTFANFAGKSIDNVRTVHPVYNFKDELIEGEYLFETLSGAYHSFSGVVAPAGFGNLIRVYQAGTGGFLIKTDNGFGAGGTLLKSSAYDGYPELFGESGIAVVNGGRLDAYQLSARSEFSLTETRYYSNIVMQCSAHGLSFHDGSNLHGFYSKEGKMISGPKYQAIALTENFVLAKQVNGLGQLMDRSGKKLIGDRQIKAIDSKEYGGYIMVQLTDGKTIMVSKSGSVVSEFADHAFTIQNYVSGGADRVYDAAPASPYIEDEETVYEVFLFAEGMQILKIIK